MKDSIKIPNDSNFHTNYVYDNQTKLWEFKGYRCIKCERTIKSPNMLDRHANNCKKRNAKIYKVDPTPIYIRDLQGKSWTPLDFNQILTNDKDSQDIKS